MPCTRCGSTHYRKNGSSYGVQRYVCKACGCSFSARCIVWRVQLLASFPDIVTEVCLRTSVPIHRQITRSVAVWHSSQHLLFRIRPLVGPERTDT